MDSVPYIPQQIISKKLLATDAWDAEDARICSIYTMASERPTQ
jgi:hypothetical protein